MTENLDIESFELTETDWKMIRKLDTRLLKVDFNDPAMVKYLLEYNKNFNPSN